MVVQKDLILLISMISEKHFKINQALDIQRLFSFLDYINIYYSNGYYYKERVKFWLK